MVSAQWRRRSSATRASIPGTALAASTALILFAAAAAIFGRSPGPNVSATLPLVALLWSLCDLLTALLLFVEFYRSGRLALAMIANAYVFSGLLTWVYIAGLMRIATSSELTLGERQVPATLYIVWHAVFAVLIMAAALYERNGERTLDRARVRRAVVVAVAVGIFSTLAFAAVVLKSANALPVFVVNGTFREPYWTGSVSLIVVVSLAAFVAILARRRLTRGLYLWLSVALLTSLLDAVMNAVSPLRSSYAWDAGKIMTACTASILLVFMLLDIIRILMLSSQEVHSRSNRGAARMRALWQISTSDGLSERDHLQMILETAASNMRTERDVLGVLSHLEGDTVVIDAIARQGSRDKLLAAAAAYAPGTRHALSEDVFSAVKESGGTRYWSDMRKHKEWFCASAGLRSLIATPIYIGNQTHFVFFALLETMDDEPFIESDVAFIDVIASNIGHRFHQRSQLERLQFHIEHDSLTGIYNRAQFNRFGRMSARDSSLFGVILIDLDSFRTINEQYGQMIGDELLVEIGSALQSVNQSDVVARLGGDDFAVLLRSTGDIDTLAVRLHEYERVFHRPFHTGDREGKVFLNVSGSFGAAQAGQGRHSFDEAVTKAGIALDHSKESGGNRGTVFGEDLEYVALERSLERAEIDAAFANDEFVLEYQPTVEMNTRAIAGAEALIRWNHPTRGRLPPLAFLGVIKRANLLGALTVWVMRRIARDILSTPLPGPLRCYFNVPAQVLDSDAFLISLQQLLEANPVLATKLGLEITESDVMDKVERAIETLKVVRKLGLLVSIDDFGTGYSSLSYLKRLPIDVVKLDKSFIDGLPDDQNDTALANMFLALTKQFALVSVGEGIETEEQAAWLCANGCMIGQGFLFSRPIPFADLIELIKISEVHIPPAGVLCRF